MKSDNQMFQCKQCGSSEFQLMLQPEFKGQVEVSTNEAQEVLIQINDRQFVADLMFMNQFAVCQCGEIKSWVYHFPKQVDGPNKASGGGKITAKPEPSLS